MEFSVQTKGHYDFIDITARADDALQKSKVQDGIMCIFVTGSTAALTTVEYESGVLSDIKDVLEKLAPENADYKHHARWGDRNGAAHIKSALMKTDLCIPITEGKLALGTWQQIVLIDFDEKPRTRQITIKIVKTK